MRQLMLLSLLFGCSAKPTNTLVAQVTRDEPDHQAARSFIATIDESWRCNYVVTVDGNPSVGPRLIAHLSPQLQERLKGAFSTTDQTREYEGDAIWDGGTKPLYTVSTENRSPLRPTLVVLSPSASSLHESTKGLIALADEILVECSRGTPMSAEDEQRLQQRVWPQP